MKKEKDNTLELGDIVEVYTSGTWEERIFLYHGAKGGIICVYRGYEKTFEKRYACLEAYWPKKQWKKVKNHEKTKDTNSIPSSSSR